jgi:hypothetical protein
MIPIIPATILADRRSRTSIELLGGCGSSIFCAVVYRKVAKFAPEMLLVLLKLKFAEAFCAGFHELRARVAGA